MWCICALSEAMHVTIMQVAFGADMLFVEPLLTFSIVYGTAYTT